MAGAPTGFTMNAKAETLSTISVRAEQCGQLTDRGVADSLCASGLYSTQNWTRQLGQRTFSSWLGISPPGLRCGRKYISEDAIFLASARAADMLFFRMTLSCSTRNRNRLSVLFVDDDADVLECFGHYFKAAGVDLTKTTDPREAIATAARLLPDVIVLDVVMPEVDGFDVFDALAARRETAQIPVVLFTGLGVQEVSKARHVCACVQKPCSPKDLLGVVRMFGGRA
jgi:CheY-like chemotaxis protein